MTRTVWPAVCALLMGVACGCVSIDAERAEIDESMWSRIKGEYGPAVGGEDASVYLAGVGERLLAHAPAHPDGPDAWKFVVLDDGAVQAFATVDGRVVITRGLVELLRTEDELAAVLARQIAHARLQHAWGFMENQINATGFFIYPKGAATKGGTRAAKVEYSAWLFHREGAGFMHPFQAWQLLEADGAALEMLDAAGYDPAAIERPLEISDKLRDTQYAYTYGHVGPRAAAAESWLDDRAPAGAQAGVDPDGFRAFRASLASVD